MSKKSIIAIIVGLAAAIATMFIVQMISIRLFPPKIDVLEAMKQGKTFKDIQEAIPMGSLILLVVSNFLGAFVGALLAKIISGKDKRSAWIVVGIFLVLVLLNSFTMGQFEPDWMLPVSLVAAGVGGILAIQLLKKKKK